jgi:hypothetical protein
VIVMDVTARLISAARAVSARTVFATTAEGACPPLCLNA